MRLYMLGDRSAAYHLLDSVKTVYEAAGILANQIEADNWTQFSELTALMDELLAQIGAAAEPLREKENGIVLPLNCECMRISLRAICALRKTDPEECLIKLRYELMTALDEAYLCFYFWSLVKGEPERENQYYEKERLTLSLDPYPRWAAETGNYKYEVSIRVQAYNHLEYTKMCVESLLNNLPTDLDCELILSDNGSTDGTAAYFEEIRRRAAPLPVKVIEARKNYGMGIAVMRAAEGKYHLTISNDVIVTPGAIENILACIRSADDIAWVVPCTSNVSNFQTPEGTAYRNWEEMLAFAQKNNVRDKFRWEQRIRLCNPIDAMNIQTIVLHNASFFGDYYKNVNMFPDDRMSLFFRRKGLKMMLAKDAYCHHFGSVTLKDEIAQQNTQKFYDVGRREFANRFGIDPWGTGFCYDPIFMERVVGEHIGHVEVLGINCGMGSNSLKIKEQIKEYCHNTDCTLTNITDEKAFILDLNGISDAAYEIARIKELKTLLYQRYYDYIVWETPFLTQYKFGTSLKLCLEHLAPKGLLLLKRTAQSEKYLAADYPNARALGNDWFAIERG